MKIKNILLFLLISTFLLGIPLFAAKEEAKKPIDQSNTSQSKDESVKKRQKGKQERMIKRLQEQVGLDPKKAESTQKLMAKYREQKKSLLNAKKEKMDQLKTYLDKTPPPMKDVQKAMDEFEQLEQELDSFQKKERLEVTKGFSEVEKAKFLVLQNEIQHHRRGSKKRGSRGRQSKSN